MNKKAVRTVTLEVPSLGRKQEFDLAHASRLLGMPNNGGWVLPKDSKFTYDKKNGIRVKPDKRYTAEAE